MTREVHTAHVLTYSHPGHLLSGFLPITLRCSVGGWEVERPLITPSLQPFGSVTYFREEENDVDVLLSNKTLLRGPLSAPFSVKA